MLRLLRPGLNRRWCPSATPETSSHAAMEYSQLQTTDTRCHNAMRSWSPAAASNEGSVLATSSEMSSWMDSPVTLSTVLVPSFV